MLSANAVGAGVEIAMAVTSGVLCFRWWPRCRYWSLGFASIVVLCSGMAVAVIQAGIANAA